MPKKNINDIRMPSYDDLFTNEEQRQEAKLEKIMELPISEIHEFKNHPFKVREDEQMIKLIESITFCQHSSDRLKMEVAMKWFQGIAE